MKLAAILLLTGIALSGLTCKKDSSKDLIYEGTVYYSSNNPTPVEGVIITVQGCYGEDGDKSVTCPDPGCRYEIGKSSTDASGHFSIDVSAGIKFHLRNTGTYFLRKDYQNYGDHINTNGLPSADLKKPEYTTIYLYH